VNLTVNLLDRTTRGAGRDVPQNWPRFSPDPSSS